MMRCCFGLCQPLFSQCSFQLGYSQLSLAGRLWTLALLSKNLVKSVVRVANHTGVLFGTLQVPFNMIEFCWRPLRVGSLDVDDVLLGERIIRHQVPPALQLYVELLDCFIRKHIAACPDGNDVGELHPACDCSCQPLCEQLCSACSAHIYSTGSNLLQYSITAEEYSLWAWDVGLSATAKRQLEPVLTNWALHTGSLNK